MKRPTIADVARTAGVSKSTVSRVLNGNLEYMREETRDHVLRAIEELNFHPNKLARSLVSKRSHSVGLLISDVSNPFYPEVIHGVENVAVSNGYDVFLCNTNYDHARGSAFIRSLVDKQVDGVLIMSSSMSDEWVQALGEHQIPAAILDWEVRHINGFIGTIAVDFKHGIDQAVDHLVELGHRRFAHISGPRSLRTSCLRQEAFLTGLSRHGIPKERVAVIEANLRIEGGRQAVRKFLELPERPTAIFSANDLTAMGFIWAAREHGLRIPQDVSIIGLDDIHLASQIDPPLTTVALPRLMIGEMAMQMLLELIPASQTQARATLSKQVDSFLVIRKSTGPAES